ncbi:MAG: hypothetical protein ACRDP6_16515 [Actinoallomurus sp.]
MPAFTYGGDVEQTYPQYIDTAKGSTLVAAPGETYGIEQAVGLTVPGEPDKDGNSELVPLKLPMPPDDRWTSASKKRDASKENG